MKHLIWSDRGSILPLAIGYFVLAASLIGVTVDLTSLVIAQKQADAVADAAAAAAADGFTFTVVGGTAVATLTDDEIWAQAEAIAAASPHDARVVAASTSDGSSARVTVSTVWHPPLLSIFMPEGLILTATATGRTALE